MARKIDGGLRIMFGEKMRFIHWTSIETAFVSNGVPDSNYCYDGIEGWVEYKKADGWRCTLRPEQVSWIARRTRAGGRVYIAVRRVEDELWIFAGADAVILKAKGLRAASPLYKGTGGPEGWDWAAIARLLTKPK